MFDQSYNPKPAFTSVQNALGGGGTNTVTVTNPGARTGTVGTAASLQISATDSGAGQTLTFSATGLPAGLAISSSGLISGTPTTSGTSSVTVTARDGTGASGSASFTWTISSGGGNTITVTNPGARTGTVGNRGQPADLGDRLRRRADAHLLRDRPAGRAGDQLLRLDLRHAHHRRDL